MPNKTLTIFACDLNQRCCIFLPAAWCWALQILAGIFFFTFIACFGLKKNEAKRAFFELIPNKAVDSRHGLIDFAQREGRSLHLAGAHSLSEKPKP